MSKNNYLVVGTVILVLGLGGGLWYWLSANNDRSNSKTVLTYDINGQSTINPNRPDGVPLMAANPSSISLTQTIPKPSSNNGLSVSNGSSSSNLGQIVPDSSSSGSNSGSSAPKALDPTKFGEYEKYKDGTTALLGELQVGNGDELINGKKAAVYYRGWLTDGRLFDMTKLDKDGKPQPFVFEMGARQVIPGWEQGLMGMKVGGTRLLIIPPSVGYGAAGQDPIPPNAVLVFEVQLLAVQ